MSYLVRSTARAMRRAWRHWITLALIGTGVGLLSAGLVTMASHNRPIAVAAAAQEVPQFTAEWAAEVAADAKLAVLEANLNRRIAELENRIWELERYRGDLDRIADLVPADYRQLVVDTARAHDLDPRALAALGWVESRWNPDVVGAAGEVGIMQILPETGAWIAERLGVEEYDLSDPWTNVKFGATYLVWLIEETGSIDEAFANYNGGPNAMERKPTAARTYVDRIRTAMATTQH